jgi:hypothetical protein
MPVMGVILIKLLLIFSYFLLLYTSLLLFLPVLVFTISLVLFLLYFIGTKLSTPTRSSRLSRNDGNRIWHFPILEAIFRRIRTSVATIILGARYNHYNVTTRAVHSQSSDARIKGFDENHRFHGMTEEEIDVLQSSTAKISKYIRQNMLRSKRNINLNLHPTQTNSSLQPLVDTSSCNEDKDGYRTDNDSTLPETIF